MNTRDLKNRVLPALLAGTRRQPLSPEGAFAATHPKAALHALSFTGQALRFEMAPAPQSFAIENWPDDARPIVPDDLRSSLLRLLNSPKCSDAAESAIAWAFARAKARPHPFDLPRMDGFVRRHAEHLGVTAQHWAQREIPAEKRSSYFDADEIDGNNWTEGPPGLRARFLEALRTRDAAGGRDLLVAAWGSESADLRLRLLGAMQTGLSNVDKAFLETAAKDRAPRVKALAQRLLARLSGTGAENPALASCLERIERTKTGVVKKRISLKLELPATVKERNAARWILEQFAGVGLDEVACALEVPLRELVDSAQKDDHLLFAFSLMASREMRFEMLETIVRLLPDAWGRMSEAGFDDIDLVDDGERTRWIETIVDPNAWMPEAALLTWPWLLRRMEGPLSAPVMKAVLASKWWKQQLKSEDRPGADFTQLFCALCPRGLRNKLREDLELLDPEPKELGSMLVDILDRLEDLR